MYLDRVVDDYTALTQCRYFAFPKLASFSIGGKAMLLSADTELYPFKVL
jgi:hypothetical protein